MTARIVLENGSTVTIHGHFAELVVGLLPAMRDVNAIEWGRVELHISPGKARPALVHSKPPIVLS